MSEVHELTAAYALDALDPLEERRYEEHLAGCDRCREELSSLRDAASALAYAVDAPAPRPALRQRILDDATRERPNVIPLRRRWVPPALSATSAVAVAAAIVLAVWASSLDRALDRERSVAARQADAISVLAHPASARIALDGAQGWLFVAPEGTATLAVSSLARAPAGKTYEAWVFDEESDRPRPAGLFRGGTGTVVVRLTRKVGRRATVAVTLERAGGVDQPTTKPLFRASLT